MKKNDIFTQNDQMIRVLQINEDSCLVIGCDGRCMPIWRAVDDFINASPVKDEELNDSLGFKPVDQDDLSPKRRKAMYERYTMIAPVLSYIGDISARSHIIAQISTENRVSKQSIRNYLKRYLILQDIQALLPKEREYCKELTLDQRNIRWSLNKYFYTHEKNSLHTAYLKMLKEKYCDESGTLMEKYPSFYQYRYFYRKTRKLENYYISRNGLTNYQRNDRPFTGDNVRTYAAAPGTGMVDSTVLDIYLVNEAGQVVGRPILTACIDAFSGMCMGYSLGWEGGVYSLRDMVINIVEDKQRWCRKFGIIIEPEDWPVSQMPARIISDQGSEYTGYTFEQITELGITLVNLPPYRPDLKGPVEKFFDVVQSLFKKNLKGKGVVEPDYLERGAHDYRQDACISITDFEKILLRCIVYYNSSSIQRDYPFTEEMLDNGIKPYINEIWRYGLNLTGVNLIPVSKEQLILCLLPRTLGKFSKYGLSVNKIRYKNNAYKEKYLAGGDTVVAYDPDCTNHVWVIEEGNYTRFDLVESRYKDKSVQDVQDVQSRSKHLVKSETHPNLQAEIRLAEHIQSIVESSSVTGDRSVSRIDETHRKEAINRHRLHAKEAGLYE